MASENDKGGLNLGKHYARLLGKFASSKQQLCDSLMYAWEEQELCAQTRTVVCYVVLVLSREGMGCAAIQHILITCPVGFQKRAFNFFKDALLENRAEAR